MICALRQVCNYNAQLQEDKIDGACNPNRGGEERVIGGKARGKDTTRKTKT
jgi:hypothetical protein